MNSVKMFRFASWTEVLGIPFGLECSGKKKLLKNWGNHELEKREMLCTDSDLLCIIASSEDHWTLLDSMDFVDHHTRKQKHKEKHRRTSLGH